MGVRRGVKPASKYGVASRHASTTIANVPSVVLGKVSGGKDLYIRLIGKKKDYYIYITPEGRIWGQYCDKDGRCDDGVDLSTKDIYEMLVKAFKA